MDRSFEAVITKVDRLGTSHMGNPSYRVTLDNHAVLRTKTDSAVGYEIDNPENIGVPVTLTVNSRGEIWNVEPIQPLAQEAPSIPTPESIAAEQYRRQFDRAVGIDQGRGRGV